MVGNKAGFNSYGNIFGGYLPEFMWYQHKTARNVIKHTTDLYEVHKHLLKGSHETIYAPFETVRLCDVGKKETKYLFIHRT